MRERGREKMNMRIYGSNKNNLGKENTEAVDGFNLAVLKDNQGRVQQATGLGILGIRVGELTVSK